jgi:hypothetical protein
MIWEAGEKVLYWLFPKDGTVRKKEYKKLAPVQK